MSIKRLKTLKLLNNIHFICPTNSGYLSDDKHFQNSLKLEQEIKLTTNFCDYIWSIYCWPFSFTDGYKVFIAEHSISSCAIINIEIGYPQVDNSIETLTYVEQFFNISLNSNTILSCKQINIIHAIFTVSFYRSNEK